MVENDIIQKEDIPPPYNPTGGYDLMGEKKILAIEDFKEAKKVFESFFIKQKLSQNENNISKTAKLIGVGRSYLYKKLDELKSNKE